MAQEVPADALGDEFKGYVLRITGGNDVRFLLFPSLGWSLRSDTDDVLQPHIQLQYLNPTRLD